MTVQDHTNIPKRVGSVLIIVGVIDIALMIYCIATGTSYSSSFNIFAIIAGIFLLKGSLRAASVVRWFSIFMLFAFTIVMIAWPFYQPLDLTITRLRLYPISFLLSVLLMVFCLGLLFWVSRELGCEAIRKARLAAGRKTRDMRIPAVLAVGLVVVMGGFLTILLGGESADRARVIAEQKVDLGYRFHVSSISISKNNRGTSGAAIVTAWNDKEIKDIPVSWNDPIPKNDKQSWFYGRWLTVSVSKNIANKSKTQTEKHLIEFSRNGEMKRYSPKSGWQKLLVEFELDGETILMRPKTESQFMPLARRINNDQLEILVPPSGRYVYRKLANNLPVNDVDWSGSPELEIATN